MSRRKTLIRMTAALTTAVVLAFAQPASGPPKNTKGDVVAIQVALDQVREALIRCQKQLKGLHYPPLQSIDLTFQTVAEKDVGGTFKLWIISFGAKRETDQTQEVTIHLTPPSPDNPTKVGAASLSESLETSIISAVEGAQNAGTKDYPLVFSGLTVNLSFAVKITGNGGISVQLVPVTLGTTGQIAKNATQTIKVVFQEPKKS